MITLNFLALHSEHIRNSKSFVGDGGGEINPLARGMWTVAKLRVI